MHTGDFEQMHVVVTGAGGGIGSAIAAAFAQQGARIIGIDRVGDTAKAFLEQLPPARSEEHLFFAADVSDSAQVETTFEQIQEAAGTVTTLVNCAGVREIAPSLDLPADVWRDVVAINLSGTFYVTQTAARSVLVDGGSIVNIASVAGLLGVASRPAYTATKHGIVGLTRCLARDLAHRRIRVNAVCPGIIRSPMTEAYFADESFLADLPVFIPLGAAGDATDVAMAVTFLASERARYITGVALPVDGGWSAEKGFSLPSESSAYLAQVLPT